MRDLTGSRIAAFILISAMLSFAAQAQSAETIVIDGSTGVTPLVAALAKTYREQHPATTVEIGKGLGTKARIQALSDGKIDIAMASHGLDVADIQRQGMAVYEIGKVAVAFGVNASVSASNLSDRQICDIYSGKARNWKELGGSDLVIAPLTRPDSEVDTEVVRDRIGCLKNLKMVETVKVMPKAGEMASELAATAGAIGMTSMTVVEQSQGRIKPLSLGGISPTADNVKNKTYALTRDSFLVTKVTPSPAVARFLEFVRSSAGEKVIIANGAVPVK
jgi:phosphate transport system substrate-binding protein